MSDRWNPEVIRNLRATPRQPNPRNPEQERIMPERLTKQIAVEDTGVDIPQPNDRPYEFRARDFKITKAILQKFGFSDDCKGCEAAMLGTPARVHSEECRKRLETAIREDDVLRTRLDMRDIRLNREPAKENETSVSNEGKDKEMEVDLGDILGEEETTAPAVAEGMMQSGAEQVQSEPPPDQSPEPAAASGADAAGAQRQRVKREELNTENDDVRDSKKRRLGLLAAARERRLNLLRSEKRLREGTCRMSGTSRRKWFAILNQLEYGAKENKQETFDISNMIGALESEKLSNHDEEHEVQRWKDMYEGMEFWDDMHEMRPLNFDMAVEARRLEMKFFKTMGVYTKVDKSEMVKAGCKPVSTKWLDTNKGDDKVPNYRSRLVGREIKMDRRLDLFSATPPLESLKFLISVCSRGQGYPEPLRLAAIDIKRAYFYAPARRPIYIHIPKEDREPGDEGKVGRLNLSLYGTRDAAQNWAHEYSTFLIGLGFDQGRSTPCNFHHKGKSIYITVHGDDFTVVGGMRGIRWLSEKMKTKYELKLDILGPKWEDECTQEIRILNRVISWEDQGLTYEPDQRHAEKLVQDMGMTKANQVGTPFVPDGTVDGKVDTGTETMGEQEATRYRAIAARLNYLAGDRPDLLFASKCVCRRMSAPRNKDWEMLKRVARYLKGCPRMIQRFDWEHDDPKTLIGYADSDWAGDKVDMKSTSGGAIQWGSHILKCWSSSQSTIALSSGEAELYAMTKVATQLAGLVSLAADFGYALTGAVKSDSGTAIGIAHRDGLGGRCRHIKVQYLWIQSRIRDKELSLTKIPGTANPADMMTKGVPAELLARYTRQLGFEGRGGRAAKASMT